MEDAGVYLLMIGGLFLLGAAGEIIFKRTQIPDVVWLIFAGVLLRTTGLVDPADLDGILPLFAALTLIIVLFDGGRQLVVKDLVQAAPKASAMAILTFLSATFGVAVILQLAALTGLLHDSWTFFHSLMVGAMVGGSSSLIIMPSMNIAKVDGKVSNLVGLESAFTDALCVVVAVVMMDIIKSGDASAGGTVVVLSKNFGFAVLLGLVAGWGWLPILRLLSGNPYAYPVTLAALMFLAVAADKIGGNAAMAVLTFSVVVGNAEALMKMVGFQLGDKPLELDDTVKTVHSQAAFVIKSFFFTYIGLMLAPPWSLLFLGVIVGVALLATRIPIVMLLARKPEFDEGERKMISISLPRGMAAGVLATMPASRAYGIEGTEDLPAMVFAAVVTSIVIFAVGFRKVRSQYASAPAPQAATEAEAEAESVGTVAQIAPPAEAPATPPSAAPLVAAVDPPIPGAPAPAPAALPQGPPASAAVPGHGSEVNVAPPAPAAQPPASSQPAPGQPSPAPVYSRGPTFDHPPASNYPSGSVPAPSQPAPAPSDTAVGLPTPPKNPSKSAAPANPPAAPLETLHGMPAAPRVPPASPQWTPSGSDDSDG